MKIPVTQELIDSVKHETDEVFRAVHFPCLTERAIRAIVGRFTCVNADGRVGINGKGHIDAAGITYMRAYDNHRWDEIKPGEFEYTPEGEAQA